VRGDELTASKVLQDKVLSHPQIDVRFNTEAMEFKGAESKLKTIVIKDRRNRKIEEINPAGAFIFIGQTPNTAFLANSGVATNQWGFIISGHDLVHTAPRPAGYESRDPMLLETSIPGIFAAGDVRADSTKQVASAAGEGATAALLIREYLKTV
jgi:thioredoxin reductase (NADPH)